MLLMGFAGMFLRLNSDFALLLNAVNSVVIPVEWKRIDVIHDSFLLQVFFVTSIFILILCYHLHYEILI